MSKTTLTINFGQIFTILTVFLVILKVTGLVVMSWLVALSPILFGIACLISMWIMLLLIFIVIPLIDVGEGKPKKRHKENDR